MDKSETDKTSRAQRGRAQTKGAQRDITDGHLLGSRVIELILACAGEAALHTSIGPEPVDDVGQVLW